MRSPNLMENLLKLDPLEQLAKEYHKAYGRDLEHTKYMLLTKYAATAIPSLSDISSPAFEAEAQRLDQQFIAQYRKDGLPDTDFIPQDCDMEIEKLLRYVHIPKHHHDFIEMVYVLCGTCYHTIQGVTYTQTQGCLTFVVSHVEHELHAAPDCLCLTMKIRSDTFINLRIPNAPYFAIPVCFNCGSDPFMRDIVLEIYSQQENRACYHDEIISHLYQVFLTYCMQNYRDTISFLYSGTPMQGRMLEIANYMYENYQTITLKSLARHFGYSESYLCRLFRSSTGQSFTTIIRSYKLEQAQKLLQTTDLKLDDICESIGYSDTTQFIRDYKKQYNQTPAKYRRQFRQANSN